MTFRKCAKHSRNFYRAALSAGTSRQPRRRYQDIPSFHSFPHAAPLVRLVSTRCVGTPRDSRFENPPFKIFIFRAVQELLFNVVKHSGVKAARIALSNSERGIIICVSDHGKGFDPENLKGAKTSSGLGLLSLRERIRHIGGTLSIESAPGQGCRFSLTFPVSTTIQGQLPVLPYRQSEITDTWRKSSDTKIRVFFADDHTVMRQGLIRLLSGLPDIEIAGEAANGSEVIEMVRQLQPDVIVMDVSMPMINGIEATRHIKTEMPNICVIGLSMRNDAQVKQSMQQAGAEYFLSKTASTAELLKAIYGAANKKRPNPL